MCGAKRFRFLMRVLSTVTGSESTFDIQRHSDFVLGPVPDTAAFFNVPRLG